MKKFIEKINMLLKDKAVHIVLIGLVKILLGIGGFIAFQTMLVPAINSIISWSLAMCCLLCSVFYVKDSVERIFKILNQIRKNKSN